MTRFGRLIARSATLLLQKPVDQPSRIGSAPVTLARDPANDPPIAVDEHRAGVAAHTECGWRVARRIEPHREAYPEVLAPFPNRIA